MVDSKMYFVETKVTEWSLLDFLEWSNSGGQMKKDSKHSVFLTLLKKISHEKNLAHAKKAQELLENWEDTKNSKAIEGFWLVWGSEEDQDIEERSPDTDVDEMTGESATEYLPSTTEESEEEFIKIKKVQKPHVVHVGENSSDGVDWDEVMERVETYRGKLSKERCVCDPLHYYIVEHSGSHGPTSKLLVDVLPQILNVLPKETHFSVPRLSEEEEDFFDKLIMADDVDDVLARTVNEKTLRKLVSRLLDSVTMIRKNDLSENEHQTRNVVPFLDAIFRNDDQYWLKYGEQSLPETAMRRNKERDPYDRARIGYKVDAIIEYQNLNWNPAVGCLEVAGGLPQCSRFKEWNDTLKLGLELRDLWASAKDRLIGVDTGNLVYWGLLVVGREIRVYALVASGGLFHLLLMHKASIPSSHQDLDNIKLVYLMLKEYKRKLDATTNALCELNKKNIKLITGAKKKNLERTPEREVVKKPKIVDTPIKGNKPF